MNAIASIKEALRMIAANPATVTAIEAAEAAQAKAQADEVKLSDGRAAKVQKALAARTEALVLDYLDVSTRAIRGAAEVLAKDQLEAFYHVTSLQEQSMFPVRSRLGSSAVESARSRLTQSAAIPWDGQGRSADRLVSDNARAAREALDAAERERSGIPTPEVAARQAAARQAAVERERVAAVNARKDAARAAGILPR